MPNNTTPNDASLGAANQLRKHYYLDRETIIAPGRGLRPASFRSAGGSHVAADPKTCPFCTNREVALYRYPTSGPWQVKVVANKYPALTTSNPEAYGAHEVIIETPDNREFSQLTHAEQVAVITTYRHRFAALSRLPNIRYVSIWKNDGPLSGASVPHAHSQILALPIVPPAVAAESRGQDEYRNEHGTCAICDVVTWEEEQSVRVIYADKHVVAIAPYAGTAPFGVWIIPRRHEGQLAHLKAAEISAIATVLGLVSARLDGQSMSFNWFLANALPHEDHHFIWKIEPRGEPWAGNELGTGVAINTIPPEYAAAWYQNKV